MRNAVAVAAAFLEADTAVDLVVATWVAVSAVATWVVVVSAAAIWVADLVVVALAADLTVATEALAGIPAARGTVE